MSVHPEIVELTKELFPLIGSFLKDNSNKVSMKQLAHFLKEKDVEGLTFRRTYPYSYQLDYIVTNLIRKGLLDEQGSFLSLTPYGKKRLEETQK